ncbi:hypothetical protein [Neorhizobium sp. LjRoot104]|uniref:hypothetical protein n=1 Tax=Neorhizobium sp. LjRoot104 TaxID=3342254 RepID=UPI003ED019EB
MIVGEVPTLDHFKLAFDAVAKQRQYDNRLTIVSYEGRTKPLWAAETVAYIAWRDGALDYMFDELAAVEAARSRRRRLKVHRPHHADRLAEMI